MFKLTSKGDFKNFFKFAKAMENRNYLKVLDSCGQQGVAALASATPVESGKTATSWRYEIEDDGSYSKIVWYNDNVTSRGDPIAIMLQYGHGTGTGGYVAGRDYINPAIQPIFDQIARTAWEAVTRS